VTVTVSAPGKLILAGEYAVLRGSVAVVAAVDRRVRASIGTPSPSSPFLAAAAAALDAAGLPAAAAIIPLLSVDSSALRDPSGAKLGLGSSAAATVAAIGCALVASGHALDRDLVHRLARIAHAAAQGSLGSGADIAASTFGGLFAFRPPGTTYPVPRTSTSGTTYPVPRTWYHVPGATYLALWSGRPADTVSLVRRVEASGTAADGAIGMAGRAAEALVAARDAAEVIAAIGMGADAMEELGRVAGVELVPEAVSKARVIARASGGEVKTCGAGGGDVAIAVFPEGREMTVLVEAFRTVGLTPLDLAFDERGVDIDAGGDYLR
jgi:phosphomevalonate kinase